MTYILEKYIFGSFDLEKEILGKHDGGMNNLDKDELLSIITIYWMTNSMCSSIRFYKVNVDSTFLSNGISKQVFNSIVNSELPVGFQISANELSVSPLRASKIKYPNIIQYKFYKEIGHFQSFQNPQETAKNVVQFIKKCL